MKQPRKVRGMSIPAEEEARAWDGSQLHVTRKSRNKPREAGESTGPARIVGDEGRSQQRPDLRVQAS